MAAKADRHTGNNHLDDTARESPSCFMAIDESLHFLFGGFIIGGHLGPCRTLAQFRKRNIRSHGDYAANFRHKSVYRDAELGQQLFRKCAHRHPDCSFAGAGTFKDISHVMVGIFHPPRKIGMARPGAGYGDGVIFETCLRRHLLIPVNPVPVGDSEGHGRAEGFPPTDAGEYFHLVLLYLHPTAAAIPSLAAGQVEVDGFSGNSDPCGHPFDDGGKLGAVGLAGGEVT